MKENVPLSSLQVQWHHAGSFEQMWKGDLSLVAVWQDEVCLSSITFSSSLERVQWSPTQWAALPGTSKSHPGLPKSLRLHSQPRTCSKLQHESGNKFQAKRRNQFGWRRSSQNIEHDLYFSWSISSILDFISGGNMAYHLGLKSLSTPTRSKNSLLRDPWSLHAPVHDTSVTTYG